MTLTSLPSTIHTVTFDCWSTLIYEAPGQGGKVGRPRLLAEAIGADETVAAAALAEAWRTHQREWHRGRVFAGPDMLDAALLSLGVSLSTAARAELLTRMEDEVLARDIRGLDGARELLSKLRAAGVRTALICDTGFVPGRTVRGLLQRLGLLEWLEVTIFSDEIGAPKPQLRAFASALSALGTSPQGAVHVGDLRRSDVAGARAAGMASVRFRGHHDDADTGPQPSAGVSDCAAVGCDPVCPRPEADAVVDSYAALDALLSAARGDQHIG